MGIFFKIFFARKPYGSTRGGRINNCMVSNKKDCNAIVALLKEHEHTIYRMFKRRQQQLERNCHRYKQESEYVRLTEHNRCFNLIMLLMDMDADKLDQYREEFDDTRSF